MNGAAGPMVRRFWISPDVVKGFAVETLYLVLMSGVAVAILVSMFEAIKAVSGKRVWEQPSQAAAFIERSAQSLPYSGVERRTQSLPYVGVERRKANRTSNADVETIGSPVVEEQRKVA
jgi:hypothetical protein